MEGGVAVGCDRERHVAILKTQAGVRPCQWKRTSRWVGDFPECCHAVSRRGASRSLQAAQPRFTLHLPQFPPRHAVLLCHSCVLF